MFVRTVLEYDLEWMRQLRNENRMFFVDDRIISEEDQIKWWNGLSQDEKLQWYIVENGECLLGMFWFGEAFIYCSHQVRGVIVCEKYRGYGVFDFIMDTVKNKLTRNQSVMVYVIPANGRALKAYLKQGFHLSDVNSFGHLILTYPERVLA